MVGLYQPTYAAYAATKAGSEAMSHILAKELGGRGITVNVSAPGPVATKLFLDGKGEDDIKPIVARTPLGRLSEPVDIARAVPFLVSPRGPNHFANAGEPADEDRVKTYAQAWPHGFADRMQSALAATDPPSTPRRSAARWPPSSGPRPASGRSAP